MLLIDSELIVLDYLLEIGYQIFIFLRVFLDSPHFILHLCDFPLCFPEFAVYLLLDSLYIALVYLLHLLYETRKMFYIFFVIGFELGGPNVLVDAVVELDLEPVQRGVQIIEVLRILSIHLIELT